MSAGSSYGKLKVETTFHTITMGSQSVSQRGQRVLENVDKIVELKETKAKRIASKVADVKWVDRTNKIIENCKNVIKSHLLMLGADDTIITKVFDYINENDVNNVRCDVLRLLVKHNPEAYKQQLAMYERIVEKQRG